MSKKRNRNVRTCNFPQNDWNGYKSNNCEKNINRKETDSNEKYFGEAVLWTSGDSSTGNSSQIFRKKSFPDGSSSSSLSWSDEYEVEQSKKVLEELSRLDKVFRRLEPIPLDYDIEEIEEWMEFFPGLTILDEKKPSCDNTNTSKPKTETVIKKIYENVPNKLFNSEKHRKAHIATAPQEDNFLDVDASTKIAPFRRTLTKRHQSSKSLFNQDYKSDDYMSLPYLHNVFNTNKRKLPPSRRRTTDRLVLPPIHNFRSMSTIPSNDGNNNTNKTSSAIAIKATNDKKLNSNRLENFFLENSLSKTTREFLQDSSHKRFVFH